MKVMIIGEGFFHYADSMVRACEMLGHETTMFTVANYKQKSPYWQVSLKKIGITYFEEQYYAKVNKNIIDSVKECSPDQCIVINGNFIKSQTLSFLKDNHIKMSLFMIDSIQYKYFEQSLNNIYLYDKIYSYEPSDIEFLLKRQCRSQYMPVGYDESIFYSDDNLDEREYDISFIGTLTKHRLSHLEKVAEFAAKNHKKFIIYTNPIYPKKHIIHSIRNIIRKIKFERKNPYLSKYVLDSPVYNNELADVYRKSKVCINIHSNILCHTGPNPRTFEILGCKTFQIIDENHLRPTDIKNEEHLVEFRDGTDLCEKIAYYLEHIDKRNEIMTAGYKIAKNKYTMCKCIEKILN